MNNIIVFPGLIKATLAMDKAEMVAYRHLIRIVQPYHIKGLSLKATWGSALMRGNVL